MEFVSKHKPSIPVPPLPRSAGGLPESDIRVKVLTNSHVDGQYTFHLMPATAADSVTLCANSDNVSGNHNTADLNLTTQAVSNIVTDTGQFKNYIFSMKRHRLLDVVCN